ncbi:MAG: NAD(P)-dependent dehydrogenase (short-subunit alcohol dehydrogenase family) [Verrucomicrobiales bacterium]|jgi:NAD(P)-dependent dehydrogenase (short-subunit alcohol dehydrogenase family)
MKLFDLSGKVALITGGGRGLGRAMAQGFSEAGAEVFITARTESELISAQKRISESTGNAVSYTVCDMSDRNSVKALVNTVLQTTGKVDILVNNAGMNIPQPIDQISDEEWDTQIEVNLSSIMALTRGLVPQMKERNWGRVIHISSVLGLGSKEARNAYSATKSALIGLCKASALDLGPHGITVNCIAPGPFLTDLPGKLLNDAQKQQFADFTAMGRWAAPEEIVGPALFLGSNASSYVTGETLLVDGGAYARAL